MPAENPRQTGPDDRGNDDSKLNQRAENEVKRWHDDEAGDENESKPGDANERVTTAHSAKSPREVGRHTTSKTPVSTARPVEPLPNRICCVCRLYLCQALFGDHGVVGVSLRTCRKPGNSESVEKLFRKSRGFALKTGQ